MTKSTVLVVCSNAQKADVRLCQTELRPDHTEAPHRRYGCRGKACFGQNSVERRKKRQLV